MFGIIALASTEFDSETRTPIDLNSRRIKFEKILHAPSMNHKKYSEVDE